MHEAAFSPEITREALPTVIATYISARCPIGDAGFAPGLIAALILAMRRSLRFFGSEEVSLSVLGDLGAAAIPKIAELPCWPLATRGTLTMRTLGS